MVVFRAVEMNYRGSKRQRGACAAAVDGSLPGRESGKSTVDSERRAKVRVGGSMALLLAFCISGWAPSAEAAGCWSDEDETYANFLVNQVGYLDTADRWLAEKSRNRNTDARCRAEVERWQLEVLRGSGKEDEYRAALKRFQSRYPWHRLAATGGLQEVGALLAPVLQAFERAAVVGGDEAKALRVEAKNTFHKQVVRQLDGQINSLTEKLTKLPEKAKERATTHQARDQAILARINFYRLYGTKWPKDAEERKAALETALELADEFVENGSDFFVMEYSCQLQRGVIAYELARYLLAFDHLSVLFDLEPPVEKPYPKPIIKAFKDLRLQALLYGARTLNASEQFSETVRIMRQHFLASSPDNPFDLTTAENSPGLRKYSVLVRLEYGVALAGDSSPNEGLKVIQAVIDKYQKSSDADSQAFVIDAQSALGKIAMIDGVKLRGQDYYRSGRGLKSQHRFEEALDVFREALGALRRRELMEYAPLCLNEIGEILLLLDRNAEAVVAYAELFEFYGTLIRGQPYTAKAAQNFLAAVTRTIDSTPSGTQHSEWARLSDLARKEYESSGGSGFADEQARMVAAQQLEQEGRFLEARESYRAIPEKVKRGGQEIVVPFYWRAQANAEAMVFEAWSRAEDRRKEGEENPLEDDRTAAMGRLGEIVSQALTVGDKDGAATAALVQAQLYYSERDWVAMEKSLRVFDRDLAELEDHRCSGVGFLAISLARQGKCEEAKAKFDSIAKACKDSQIYGPTARDLSDCFYDAGDGLNAARFSYRYGRHPSSKADRKRLDTLLTLAGRLAEGAGLPTRNAARFRQAARKYFARAKKHPEAKGESRRALYLIGSKLLRAEGKHKVAVKALERYITEFNAADGVNEEDPYVYRDLAEIYWTSRDKPAVKDARLAAKNYEAACALLNQRLARVPTLEPTFWQWALSLMRVRAFLAESGDANAAGRVISFIETRSGSEMGGLKSEFTKILTRVKRLN